MNFLKKLFDHEYKELVKFEKTAEEVMQLEEEISKLSDKELTNKTEEFRKRLANNETLEDIKVEAFAVAREAAFRVIGEKPYYVQIVGGLAIHNGNIAEMKTGEGKTLTSTLPAYLNALEGKGVHIITVNEYLAERDAEWMGKIYRFLGLTVGKNMRDLSNSEKRDAYNCDILYSTNNEIGFDYLRDNMVVKKEERVQRPFNFVIVDEVDSVLIDEARTPLIISGGQMNVATLYTQADNFIKTLKENKGYIYDEKTKSVNLDSLGVEQAEKAFNIDNLFDLKHTNLVHLLNQALRGNFAMKKDFDYVVAEDKIVIVDQFTGRLMEGRAYSDGLHQAIEAKEKVTITEETKTLATITFQNLFRMYDKLSGMTGTAKTEEEEFRAIYNMYVIEIPTNKPITREDFGDLIFATKEGKYKAIIQEIKDKYKVGQPILVGTIGVETSELISRMLKKERIPHEILNAKNHGREAEIIEGAGKIQSVTIATNMAGRGTDIKISEEVKELGGLCVIGTERHESRRIDNQLRGRAGRQGDPGYSQFCVSFEDDLMVRFGTDRAKLMLQRVGFDGDLSIRNKMFSNMIESAQKRVEGNNFDIRKTLLEYDNVINNQRSIMYEKRNQILDNEEIKELTFDTLFNYVNNLINSHLQDDQQLTELSKNEILEVINGKMLKKTKIKIDEIENQTPEQITDYIYSKLETDYTNKLKDIPEEITNEFEKAITLRVIDTHWMEHINTMAHLKEGIGLRGYAQEDPLRAYTAEGFELFDTMLSTIEEQVTQYLMNAEIKQNTERKEVIKGKAVTNNSDDSRKSKPKRVEKVGRNDDCPCGSGKKYKNCCGR